uniref:E3 ubiquitin-protein ligase n=1 Tax=Panagrellus redivivus TaxID=6233 RepID=A0A7E4V0J5_PANRE
MQRRRPDGDHFSPPDSRNRTAFPLRRLNGIFPRTLDFNDISPLSPPTTPRAATRPMLLDSEDEADARAIMIDYPDLLLSDAMVSGASDIEDDLEMELEMDEVDLFGYPIETNDGNDSRQSEESTTTAMETVDGNEVLRHVDDCVAHLRRNLQLTVAEGFEAILQRVAQMDEVDTDVLERQSDE